MLELLFAVQLIAMIQTLHFSGNQIVVDFTVEHVSGQQGIQRTTRSALAANITASGFESGIKNLIINYVQQQYGITLTQDDIVLGWGGQ